MKRVYSGMNLAETTHFKNLLEQAGIASFIKNLYLTSAVGDLPPFDSWPQLWVYRDDDASRAEDVIREALRPPLGLASAAPWRCASCGESNEAQFAACWRCGARDSRT
jgi:hypothetical protein